MSTDPRVDASWLIAHLDEVLVLDATVHRTGNPHHPYSHGLVDFESGHITGAGFADLVSDLSDPHGPWPFTRPNATSFAESAGKLGVGPHTHVVLYDQSTGAWAARVWWLLRTFGHDRVSVLDGGLRAWRAQGGAIDDGPPAVRSPAEFLADEQPNRWATAAEVLDLSSGPSAASVVCALRAEDYSGEHSEDPRHGHIPGSINIAYPALLRDDGLLDEGQARRAAAQLARTAPDGAVLYCGGGINAAGLAWALHVAGYQTVRIYDESMSQWRATPTLPVTPGRRP